MQTRLAGCLKAEGAIENRTALGGKGCREGPEEEADGMLVIADPLPVCRRRFRDDPWHRSADRSAGSREIRARVGGKGHRAWGMGEILRASEDRDQKSGQSLRDAEPRICRTTGGWN